MVLNKWMFFSVLLAVICSVQSFVCPHEPHRSTSCLYEIKSSLVSVRDVLPEETGSNNMPPSKQILYHVDFKNFWQKTRGHFTPCVRPLGRSPDFKSKNSWYWDVDDEYVIRSSDHWSNACGNIKDCFWTFDEEAFRANSKTKKQWLTGKCNYADLERGKKSSMKVRVNDRKVL
jgi:hypothetical protein